MFSACSLQMRRIPGIVGGLKYVEFDFYFPHTAAGFLSHFFYCLVRFLAKQLVNGLYVFLGVNALASDY